MGKASSAKKVARAARAGGSGRATKTRRNLLFPATIGVIVVLGVALLFFAVNERKDERAAAADDHPTLQDHWHAAYGIRLCADSDGDREGGFQAPFVSENDPDGIHTHSDGIIHVHPFGSGAAGENAELGVFFDAMGVTINDDTIDLGNDVKVSEGDDTCGENDKPGIVQVARWENAREAATTEPEIITEDIEGINFLNDSEAFTIAFAPEGADLPPPPTIPQLDQLTDVPQSEQNTPTTPFDPATATSVPASTPPSTAGAESSGTTAPPTTAAP